MFALQARLLLTLALLATLAACGGSSKPASGCTRAAIPGSGPGDTLNYFPAEVGRSWLYDASSGGTVSQSVTGTQVVSGETASVFMTTSTADPTPTQELVVKRPAGVYVLADASGDPALAGMYPSLVLPFPVAVLPRTQQVTCTGLDMGDLDGDGKVDRASLVGWLTVISTIETATITAGSFTDVAHLLTEAQVTVTTSSSGSLTLNVAQDDWYARGVGRIVSHVTLTIPGYTTDTETDTLVSTTAPPASMASLDPAASAGGRAAARPSLEQVALEAARRHFRR